jgi:hypothetical protein
MRMENIMLVTKVWRHMLSVSESLVLSINGSRWAEFCSIESSFFNQIFVELRIDFMIKIVDSRMRSQLDRSIRCSVSHLGMVLESVFNNHRSILAKNAFKLTRLILVPVKGTLRFARALSSARVEITST